MTSEYLASKPYIINNFATIPVLPIPGVPVLLTSNL
jgi:hypothetical protein